MVKQEIVCTKNTPLTICGKSNSIFINTFINISKFMKDRMLTLHEDANQILQLF